MADPVIFSPRFGRVLVVAVGVVSATILISALDSGVESLLRALAPVALLMTLSWAAYWRPAVVVGDEEVEVRNVFSTDTVRYEEIRRIDTRYALTLETAQGKVTAWAAPAPGRHRAVTARAEDGSHLPESSYLQGTVRPGDLAGTDSGTAALLVRRRWEDLRDSRGSIGDGPARPRQRRWHRVTIAVSATLVIASVLSVTLS